MNLVFPAPGHTGAVRSNVVAHKLFAIRGSSKPGRMCSMCAAGRPTLERIRRQIHAHGTLRKPRPTTLHKPKLPKPGEQEDRRNPPTRRTKNNETVNGDSDKP